MLEGEPLQPTPGNKHTKPIVATEISISYGIRVAKRYCVYQGYNLLFSTEDLKVFYFEIKKNNWVSGRGGIEFCEQTPFELMVAEKTYVERL